MIEAWNLQNKKNAAILFVIEDVTYNICDQVWKFDSYLSFTLYFPLRSQRFHEFYIRQTHPEIKVLRKTLTEIHEHGTLGPNEELFLYVKRFPSTSYKIFYLKKILFFTETILKFRWFISGQGTSQATIQRKMNGMLVIWSKNRLPSNAHRSITTWLVQKKCNKHWPNQAFLVDS